jgi:hypothetical protein
LQDLQQPCVGPGFFHEISHAALHGLDGQPDGSPAGHHNDRRQVFVLLQQGEQVQTFLAGGGIAGIVQIHQQEIEFIVGKCFQQIRSRGHALGRITVAFQQQAQGVENILLVIGNEDAVLHRFDFHRDLKRDTFHQNRLHLHASFAVIGALFPDVRSRTSSAIWS